MKSGAPGARGKRSGLPSTRASDAAERSQAVYFANLKADMLLQKQRQVLKRAEKSLVHCVTIDQKILFRRFQAKLRRSKIARARLWGDKDTERELRARDLHVMNTNCGQEEDDLEFLKKLEQRPCIVDQDSEPEEGKPKLARKTNEVTDKDMEEFIRAVMEEQIPSVTEKNLQSLSTIGHLMEETRLVSPAEPSARDSVTKSARTGRKQAPRVTIRPLTTPGPRADMMQKDANISPVKTNHPSKKAQKPNRVGMSGEGSSQHTMQSHFDHPPTSPYSSSHPGQKQANARDKARPMTSSALTQGRPRGTGVPDPRQTLTPSPFPSPRTKSAHGALSLGGSSVGGSSRRPSQAATSMFEEQKKVDVVALRLKEARSTDLTPKVSAFLKSLLELDKKERTAKSTADTMAGGPAEAEELGEPIRESVEREEEEEEKKEELKGDRKFDYYATKMALYAARVKRDPHLSLPGTPEEVNMKLVGDQTIKSITMPRLSLNYGTEGVQEEGFTVKRVGEAYPRSSGAEFHRHSGPNILTIHHE